MTATMKKYADVVRAYLDGAEVQMRLIKPLMGYTHSWITAQNPQWSCGYEYRIKPKEPRVVEKFIPVGRISIPEIGVALHSVGISTEYSQTTLSGYILDCNIKLLYNEETGEILSVELIKENK